MQTAISQVMKKLQINHVASSQYFHCVIPDCQGHHGICGTRFSRTKQAVRGICGSTIKAIQVKVALNDPNVLVVCIVQPIRIDDEVEMVQFRIRLLQYVSR